MKLLPGDIVFSRDTTTVSKIIQWFLGCKWSHVFIVLDPDEDHTYILETSSYEVWINTLESYDVDPNAEYAVYRADLPPKVRSVVVKKCFEQKGKSYGYLQLFSLGLRSLLKKMKIVIPNLLRHGVVCCHIVMYGFRHSGIPQFHGMDPEALDTADVYDRVREQRDYFKLIHSKDARIKK